MAGDGDGEQYEVLADHRLGRLGVHVKLDKGFQEGTYCVCIEFDGLAERLGFAAARLMAGEYCALLKDQLGRSADYALGRADDPSLTGDPRRRRDLEATFLSFAIETADGRFHDAVMKEQYRVASLRAGQAWDQAQALTQTHRRHSREERFRERLARLLDGRSYAALGVDIKERLLAEVPALAFPVRGVEQ